MSDALPRKVVVGTAMYAMWGEYPGVERRLEALGEIIDEMARQAAERYPGSSLDLVVLPEDAVCGGRSGSAAERSVALEGPVLERMAAKARQYGTYVVVPLFLVENREEGLYTNAAALLDRTGKVAGIYRKVHPVAAKSSALLEDGVAPGTEFPVFECDFGRLGIQICFDIEFGDGWEALARQGAEIVAWPSQSPQTVQPAARAAITKSTCCSCLVPQWIWSAILAARQPSAVRTSRAASRNGRYRWAMLSPCKPGVRVP